MLYRTNFQLTEQTFNSIMCSTSRNCHESIVTSADIQRGSSWKSTTLHSHLLPAHTAPPHSHLYFGYKLPVRFAHLGLSQPSVRTELPSTSIQPTPLTPANTQPLHTLARYTKEPWLYPPPALTKERSSVGRAQAPHSLASHWCPLSIYSSNGLGCIVEIYV